MTSASSRLCVVAALSLVPFSCSPRDRRVDDERQPREVKLASEAVSGAVDLLEDSAEIHRREVEALQNQLQQARQRIAQLEQELAPARARIAELEKRGGPHPANELVGFWVYNDKGRPSNSYRFWFFADGTAKVYKAAFDLGSPTRMYSWKRSHEHGDELRYTRLADDKVQLTCGKHTGIMRLLSADRAIVEKLWLPEDAELERVTEDWVPPLGNVDHLRAP